MKCKHQLILELSNSLKIVGNTDKPVTTVNKEARISKNVKNHQN